MAESQASTGELKGALSPFHIFSLAFGAIVGVGWIVLLGQWLDDAGPIGAILAFVAGGVIVGLIAPAYIYAAQKLPFTGGEVIFVYEALGRTLGFFVSWALLYTTIAICAFEAISISWILGALFPWIEGPVLYTLFGQDVRTGSLLIGIAFTIAFALIHIRGTQIVTFVQDAMIYIFVIACIIFIAAGFLFGSTDYLEPALVVNSEGWKWAGVVSVFAVAPVFYCGFNFAVQAMGERAPNVSVKSVGIALLCAIAASGVFYALVIFSAALAAPRDVIVGADLPTAAAFEAVFQSKALSNLVLISGLLGLLTAWNSLIFASARMIFVLSKRGELPAVLSHTHPKHGTPDSAVLWITIFTIVGTIGGSGAIGYIIGSASITIAFAYVTVAIASIYLWRRDSNLTGHIIRAVSLIAALFLFAVTLLEPFLARPEWHVPVPLAVLGLWLAIGLIVMRQRKPSNVNAVEA
ncbi:MAG: APC family permease [Pseudomonadota bacterium]